jgi:hypothetical protein
MQEEHAFQSMCYLKVFQFLVVLFKLLDSLPPPQKNCVQAQPYVLVLLVCFSDSVHFTPVIVQTGQQQQEPNNVVIYSTNFYC